MENTSEKKDKNSVKKPLKHICIGLVAHVDAGKTTLSEGMLYLSGQIRNMGRVDHGDTFLDNYETERERGITIFSKQAEFIWNDTSITILDTPGHVDFSAEMERVLQVLDCAVLVVSAVDGVQAHTVTLWRLLKQYKIPTMIFVNKMDQEGTDGEKLLKELRKRFGENVVPFVDIMTESDCPGGKVYLHTKESAVEEVLEELAVCEDDMMEEYLEEAKKMRALTEKYNVPLLIDDNIKLAKACGADGVHVGQNDMDAGLARQLLGPDKILGVTAKTVEQALKAQSQGADYLGSGAVFGTSTKKDARPMTMEQLQAICASVKIPVVAIGGICLDNIEKLQGSGVAGAAIVSGIFAAEDIEGTTRALRQKMERII